MARAATLTVRIAAVLLAAAAGVFALSSIVLDQVLNRQLAQRDAAELVGKVTQLRHLLGQRRAADEVRADPHGLFDVIVGHDGLGFVLSQPDGRLIVRAGTLADSILQAALPGARIAPPTEKPSMDDVQFIEQGRSHWRVLVAQAQLQGGQIVQVAVGRDVHAAYDLRSTYQTVMLAGSLIAAFGTALAGWLAAWRGIRPLADMAQAARRITARRLAERIPVPAGSAREIRELADAFNGMIDRLENAFARLSGFSADLAHDLRTPLANLLLQSQVGLSKARSVDEYQQLLATNVEEFERLQRMIDGMLFLARADNAQIALDLEQVDVRAELERMAEYFQLAADERGVNLAVEGGGTVLADAALLQRAIGNLLSNAIRHAHPGSRVRLHVAEAHDSLVVEITNQGEGIAPEDLAHVFERFWRGDQARSASDSSSGLGLSIVRSIAQLHGGEATVQSEPGGTTTFRMRLPPKGAGPTSSGPSHARPLKKDL